MARRGMSCVPHLSKNLALACRRYVRDPTRRAKVSLAGGILWGRISGRYCPDFLRTKLLPVLVLRARVRRRLIRGGLVRYVDLRRFADQHRHALLKERVVAGVAQLDVVRAWADGEFFGLVGFGRVAAIHVE